MRVRYADTDADGVVYYANYLAYFEVVRVEWLRALGYPITRILEQGIILPVVEARLKYLRPARVDDLLTVRATLASVGPASFAFDYEVDARGRPAAGDRLDAAGRVRARHRPRLRHAPLDARPVCRPAAHGTDLTMGNVYRFPGGELPPDFETRMPDDIEVKHCYRHPDRETGVSCSNCGRPICHECMIPAPVGFRCPECVKRAERAAARAPRSSRAVRSAPAGAPARWAARRVSPPPRSWSGSTSSSSCSGSWPRHRRWAGSSTALVWGPRSSSAQHEYWRMFTSLFLHSGIFHIAFNMWALWIVGGFVETVLGRHKFVILYFISGFAGSVLVLVAAPNAVVVGASGAIFGVFGALAVHAFLNRGRDFQSRSLLGNVLFLLVINLVFSFMGGISWQAHIGGLVGGAATMVAMMLGGRKDPRAPFELPDGLAVLGDRLRARRHHRVAGPDLRRLTAA